VGEGFTCEVSEYYSSHYRSACEGLGFYGEHGGKRYCVLHFPGEEKKDDFEEVKKSKLDREDYDFGGTVFPEGTSSDFERRKFDANTNFDGATFLGKADFSEAQLSSAETSFSGAQFSGEETTFSRAQFSSGETLFQEATFMGRANFTRVTFREKVAFFGTITNSVFSSQAWAEFGDSRIEKPELLTFNTVLLHAGWFINVDVRKVDFTDVKWYGMPGGPEGTLDEEIGALAKRGVESPYTLLSQACQRLAANAEENRDYWLANGFYYWSMDALRKAGWRRLGLIRTMYWALSGYGVRAARAFLVLLGIWAAFTILYILVPSSPFSGFSVSDFEKAIVYSLGAMARLNPEPRPDEPGLFQFLVTVEGLLGPLQIALLALAIRRKVMR
jgi:hypothetical protein